MRHSILEKMMRRLESYHGLRVPDEAIPVIRVDGRSFTQLVKKAKFKRPFDPEFTGHMVDVAKALLKEFNGVYAYTQSDEISIALRPEMQLFDREVEKLVSVSAALAASTFAMAGYNRLSNANLTPSFDSRVLVVSTYDQLEDYFRWRQSDAERNYLNGLAHWTAVKSGMSPRAAGHLFEGKSKQFKLDYLTEKGVVNPTGYMAPEATGIGLTWGELSFNALNKMTGERVATTRRTIDVTYALPTGDAYGKFINGLY